MNEIAVVDKGADWRRLKSLVVDSVSSPITKRVYNLGLDEFFAWYGQEPRPGFTKATVAAWRVALEARGLAVSINVRITAVRKLAVEAADNGLLAPELANGITRVKGVASKGVRLGNWLTAKQAQALLNAPDATTTKGLRDRAILAVLLGCGLRRSEVAARTTNADSWLKDETGGRRFWPVRCRQIDLDGLRRDRDQLWAEALHLCRAGTTWWLDEADVVQDAIEEQRSRYQADIWQETIAKWLEEPVARLDEHSHPVAAFHATSDSVSIDEVLHHCIGKPLAMWSQLDKNRVAACLVSLGWERHRVGPRHNREYRYRKVSQS